MGEPPFGHESSAVAVRPILAAGAILAAGVILTVSVILFVLHQRLEPTRTREYARVGLIPPAPRLEPYPTTGLTALRTQKRVQLESWGWTDETRQFAHIPIERAMTIYARQHNSNEPAGPGTARARQGGR